MLAICFAANFVIYGFATSVGVYHVQFLKEFPEESSAVISWISSTQSAAAYIAGEIDILFFLSEVLWSYNG